jgi:hypothetical protein
MKPKIVATASTVGPREATVLVRYFVRLKIVDPSGSISSQRQCNTISRSPQAYSRYQEPCGCPSPVR